MSLTYDILCLVKEHKSLTRVGNLLGISRQRVWQHIHKKRSRTQEAVKEAVKRGKLTRPNKCERCLKCCKPEAHHEDYNKRFDVKWLCQKCHRKADRLARPRYKKWDLTNSKS